MSNILVTGATGFIGKPLCAKLLESGARVRAAVWCEDPAGGFPTGLDLVRIDSIGPDTDWTTALTGIDVVIHLAARVHVMDEKAEEPLAAYRLVNVAGTEKLARMAVASGVKRLVFLSSIKVHGEETATRYTEQDTPAPRDAYGVSKLEAEEILKRIAVETGLEIVIVRSPLVYGPYVKANFYRLMGIVMRGLPLPFGSVNNTRSLVYLGNLIDAILLCTKHPLAAGQTFLIRDGEDISTPQLIRNVASALGLSARLFSFPPGLMRLAGRLTGKTAAVDRLLGSLAVDDSKIRKELGWKPPFTMAEGLKETGAWYKRQFGG